MGCCKPCDCCCMDRKIKRICEETCQNGIPGSQGVPGADGLSAYEVALSEGYEGTEEEWLESLIGAPGEKGDKGDPGPSIADDIIYYQAQSQTHAGEAVSRIPFDTIIWDGSNGIIEVDSDGYIIFHDYGLYKIDWQLSYDDPNLGAGDLQVLYAVNNGPYTFASYNSNKGFISGSITIDTKLAEVLPLYTSLNFSGIGHDVPLGDTRVQTNITIVRLKKT